jgi:HSP20 family protein
MRQFPSTRRDWYLNPFAELENLQREMNKLFDLSGPRTDHSDVALLGGQWAPAIDLYDSKDNIVVKIDLPGMKKEDIDITIQENVLSIKGEKKRLTNIPEDGYVRTERSFGSFYRSVTLPASVDRDKVQAVFNNGVLDLTLPKKEEAKPKQIKVDVK